MKSSPQRFINNGPEDYNGPYLKKNKGEFIAPSIRIFFGKREQERNEILQRIANALNKSEYALASIYFAQLKNISSDTSTESASEKFLRKYNQNEPRDYRGRWTNGASSLKTTMIGTTGPIDPMCMIHKRGATLAATTHSQQAIWFSVFQLCERVHGCRWLFGESIMQTKSAKIVIDFLLLQSKQQNQFLIDLQKSIPDADFEQAKMIIAHTMGAIYSDGLYPLLKMYPELIPPGLKV